MKTKIYLNDDVPMDLDVLLESRLLVQANSGAGKSWTVRRILEQSHGKVQQIILDPEGEFSSLREKYDYVLAGKEGDTPADPRSAALLAHKLLELKVSAIIDLYELHPQERKHFVKLFVDAMVNAPKELWPINYNGCIVVIDEAHTFVPEKGQSEAADAVISLASLGRKRGICAVLATQRISKLHKDAAAECNNKLIGRSSLDIDRKRAAEELGFDSKEQTLSLRKLAPGEFYAFGPAISDEVIKLQIGPVESKVPKKGNRKLFKIAPPTSKIKELLPQLADLPAEAKKEAQTTQELKTENAQLKRQLIQLPQKIVEKNPNPVKIKHIEVPMVGKRTLEKLKVSETAMRKMIKQSKELTDIMVGAFEKFSKDLERVSNNPLMSTSMSLHENSFKIKPGLLVPGNLFAVAKNAAQNTGVAVVSDNPLDNAQDFKPSASQQRILNALNWAENLNISPIDKSQVALLADQSPSSGGYFNNLGVLRTAGLIDYPSPGLVMLTEEGRAKSEAGNVPKTTEEMHEQLFRKLSASQVNILKALISIYPNQISKSELAIEVHASPTSGGYFNNLGRLRSLGLIDYPSVGMVVANKVLFL